MFVVILHTLRLTRCILCRTENFPSTKIKATLLHLLELCRLLCLPVLLTITTACTTTPAPTPPAEPVAVVPALSSAQLHQWLDSAQLALRENRLTYPKDNSALYFYQQILAREAEQKDAIRGLEHIVELHIERAMQAIAHYSQDQLAGLMEDTGLTFDHGKGGVLQTFRSEESWQAGQRAASVLESLGISHRLVLPHEIAQIEPALAGSSTQFTGALHLPDDQTGDCAAFCKSVANWLEEHGVGFSFGTDVLSIEMASNRFAVAADLGIDQVVVYGFDPQTDLRLLQSQTPPATVDPGSGPRHFAFHPSGKFAYVINELSSTVTAFDYDRTTGELNSRQTLSTLPADFDGVSHTAEVVVHPSGKFVYGSNRGHDSIAVFSVNAETGTLTQTQVESTGGKTPRNFVVDPEGKFLLAENQGTNTINVFRIDPMNGELSATEHAAEVPSPVCIRFWNTSK